MGKSPLALLLLESLDQLWEATEICLCDCTYSTVCGLFSLYFYKFPKRSIRVPALKKLSYLPQISHPGCDPDLAPVLILYRRSFLSTEQDNDSWLLAVCLINIMSCTFYLHFPSCYKINRKKQTRYCPLLWILLRLDWFTSENPEVTCIVRCSSWPTSFMEGLCQISSLLFWFLLN